ncbi:MAG: LysM peptidoglycan-binding domain-containing protein [Candidatus Latescibacter sp.]|nr:LysM peptidoglycan-binding domain-containing protein [Candidatus Latescibacter sp.]
MKKVLAISALLLFAAPALSSAQNIQVKKKAPAFAPEKYVVKKGDTLWDISRMQLGDPFVWPEVWKKNPFIKDPHWIYPGQELMFRPKTEVIADKPAAPPAPVSVPAPAAEPQPAQPQQPAQVAVAVKVPEKRPMDKNVIRMLQEPRQVFTEKNFMRTGFIAKQSELSRTKIVKIENEKDTAIRYDTLVIDSGAQNKAREGDLFAVIAMGDRVKHPETGVDYGYVVRIKGVLKAISTGERQSRCTVLDNFDPLEVGDLVMPYKLASGPRFDAWIRPDAEIRGVILAINETMLSIHINDILYIDKGANDGVRPGDVFDIYQRKSNLSDTGHLQSLGQLEAVSVMPSETAVIVTSLKGETITVGDWVKLAARCRIIQ